MVSNELNSEDAVNIKHYMKVGETLFEKNVGWNMIQKVVNKWLWSE